jgi:hypothetical protein
LQSLSPNAQFFGTGDRRDGILDVESSRQTRFESFPKVPSRQTSNCITSGESLSSEPSIEPLSNPRGCRTGSTRTQFPNDWIVPTREQLAARRNNVDKTPETQLHSGKSE